MAAADAEYRCGGTWFPGVNILDNAPDGSLDGVSLDGPALGFVRETLGFPDLVWDRAQISGCLPGYPRPGAEETEAAARYRRVRDAAHVDGLLRIGDSRRRRLGERHGFILGLPIAGCVPGASPLVVWEGSHETMRAAFANALAGAPPARWGEIDLTEAYQEARRRCFEACRRVEIQAQPGEAYLVHRLALHGVAPWAEDGPRSAAARIIAYLRPDPFPDADPRWWLERP